MVRGHHAASRNVRKSAESHRMLDLLSPENKVLRVPCHDETASGNTYPKLPHSDLEEGLSAKLCVSLDSRSRLYPPSLSV